MVALDISYPVSKNLMRLYIYVNRCLNHARIQRKDTELDAAEKVLRGLYQELVKFSLILFSSLRRFIPFRTAR